MCSLDTCVRYSIYTDFQVSERLHAYDGPEFSQDYRYYVLSVAKRTVIADHLFSAAED